MSGERLQIPGELVKAIQFLMGSDIEGRAWIQRAETRVLELAASWDVTVGRVLEGGAMSLCVEGMHGSEQVVLKFPTDVPSGLREAAAHKVWPNSVSPAILEQDLESGAFLMSWMGRAGLVAEPRELKACVDLLHVPVPLSASFPNVIENIALREKWAFDRFHKSDDKLRLKLLEQALGLARELCASSESSDVLLHGDLQGKNLMHNGAIGVIDPLPVVGPAEFDLGFWIAMGPHGRSRRRDIVRELSLDFDDAVYQWAWVFSVIEDRPYLEVDSLDRADFVGSGFGH